MRWTLMALAASAAFANPSFAQSQAAGRWVVTLDHFGTPTYWTLQLDEAGGQLSGTLAGDTLTGTVTSNRIRFLAKDGAGGSEAVTARIVGGRMVGEVVLIDGAEPSHTPHVMQFTAERVRARAATAPVRHDFVPTKFYRQFSPFNAPVLRINPGDTIHTTTVDAAGIDEKGVRRVTGGNPQTGPFYVEGAMPGDTLAVHIVRLKLNRATAISTNGIVERGQDSRTAVRMNGLGKMVTWTLDLAHGLARPADPGPHMRNYAIPVRPMLGGIAVATRPNQAPPGTGDSGNYGGNMDFNELGEGAAVFLPVMNPGALLYFGDGHALQGDGETTGDALETSMDVEVRVELISGKSAGQVRIETPTHLVAMGLDGSLDTAFKGATANMAAWLASDYNLTPAEFAQVLGTAAEYKVSEVADRNAGIVLKLSKARLALLERDPPK